MSKHIFTVAVTVLLVTATTTTIDLPSKTYAGLIAAGTGERTNQVLSSPHTLSTTTSNRPEESPRTKAPGSLVAGAINYRLGAAYANFGEDDYALDFGASSFAIPGRKRAISAFAHGEIKQAGHDDIIFLAKASGNDVLWDLSDDLTKSTVAAHLSIVSCEDEDGRVVSNGCPIGRRVVAGAFMTSREPLERIIDGDIDLQGRKSTAVGAIDGVVFKKSSYSTLTWTVGPVK